MPVAALTPAAREARELLLGSFQAAVAAADPLRIVPQHLPLPPKGRTLVVGAGKAAAAMALAIEQHWPPHASLDGLVITRYRHGLLTNRIRVVEAGHPVPDDAGVHATREVLRLVRGLGRDDLLLVVVSGGGSSLLTLPADGLGLADLQAVNRALLGCGAPVQDINVVRKHLSGILGGRLATASKAPVLALIVSDVTGDAPSDIASGPCAPDASTFADALLVLDRFGVEVPVAVQDHLQRGRRLEIIETPKPGDRAFARVENRVIVASQDALQAAASYFRSHGIAAAVLGDSVSGEAAEIARMQAAIARQVARHSQPWAPPVALISGGECTVTVRDGGGRGGRCSEFLLSLGIAMEGVPNAFALACDTDGIDGTEDNAGALLAPDTLQRARHLGLDPAAVLSGNDSWRLFSATDDLVVTGPTRTNVNDYRVILLLP